MTMSSQPVRAAVRALFPSATSRTLPISTSSRPLLSHAVRRAHFKAFDAQIDADDLAEARKWHGSFDGSGLPRGTTAFARSSGPGGQHVNK